MSFRGLIEHCSFYGSHEIHAQLAKATTLTSGEVSSDVTRIAAATTNFQEVPPDDLSVARAAKAGTMMQPPLQLTQQNPLKKGTVLAFGSLAQPSRNSMRRWQRPWTASEQLHKASIGKPQKLMKRQALRCHVLPGQQVQTKLQGQGHPQSPPD